MNGAAAFASLSKALIQRKEFITIDDSVEYKLCRVQWYGKGVILRKIVLGAEVKTKQQQVCRTGEFLVAEIDAKEGGFGVVPEELDGSIVSSHYFLFSIDEMVLVRDFLALYIQTPAFQEQVAARGSTNYSSVRPNHVLDYQVPLPPLDEQRRIVVYVDALADRIAEARGLRQGAVEEAGTVMSRILHQIFVVEENSWQLEKVEHAAEIIDPNPSHRMPRYAETGVPFISTVDFEGSEGIKRNTIKYVQRETFLEQLDRCQFAVDDILFSRIGTIGKARILTEVWDFALSHVLVVVKPNRHIILPRFLLWYLRSDSIQNQASEATRSIGVPDLGIKRIRDFHMPLPALAEQREIVAYLDSLQARVDALKGLQADAAAELDALLPSILDRAFKGEL